jgi:glycine cleavage system H protein
MKEINEMNLPENVLYSTDHEWSRVEDEKVRIGISDYAQDQLGEIVFVEVPEVGATFKKGDVFGTLESVKAVAEMLIPISCEVLAVNTDLEGSPELVNQDPYDKGWIIDVKPDDSSELNQLMNKDTYLDMLKGMGK